nr:GrpB family protein [Microvirga zambiensis]
MKEPLTLVPYDPHWPRRFEALATRASAALSPLPVRIEHVGSTSIPGLSAKTIIDLDVVADPADVPEAVRRLSEIGYVHKGDQGLAGREALLWPPRERQHRLYVCRADSPALHEHILFRDFLRANPEEVKQYERLKRALAARFADDRVAYQAGKASFIDAIMARIANG